MVLKGEREYIYLLIILSFFSYFIDINIESNNKYIYLEFAC